MKIWRGKLGPGHTLRWGLFGPAVTLAPPPAFPRNPRGRLGFPGPTHVNETEVDVFFWNSLAFSMIQQILGIWSLVPLPFLNPAWISGSSPFTYCWSLCWRILSITLLACEMNAIVQQFEHSLALQCWRPGLDPWVGKILGSGKWQPTPVILPGEFHGQGSLVGCNPWGRTESDTTEVT